MENNIIQTWTILPRQRTLAMMRPSPNLVNTYTAQPEDTKSFYRWVFALLWWWNSRSSDAVQWRGGHTQLGKACLDSPHCNSQGKRLGEMEFRFFWNRKLCLAPAFCLPSEVLLLNNWKQVKTFNTARVMKQMSTHVKICNLCFFSWKTIKKRT